MTVYRDRKEEVVLVCNGTSMSLSDAESFTEYGVVKAFAYAMLEYAAPYRGTGKYNPLTIVCIKDS